MNNVRAGIFDCDGVLFESRRANLAYYNVILEQFGEPPVDLDDPVKATLCHTAASSEVLATLLGEERATPALEFAAGLDYRQFIPYMDPEPGMVDGLARLSAAVPLAVATNRGTSMPEILRHFSLDSYFSVVVTSRDVSRPKPEPDMLLLAAERLGIERDRLLFVGDSVYDRRAAESAGIPFAAYKWDADGHARVDGHSHLAETILAALG